MNLPRETINGHEVTSASLEECLVRVAGILESRKTGEYFACANPHCLEVARKDLSYRRALADADFLVPDGIGMVIASRILGGKIRGRITGMDVFQGLSAILGARKGFSYFFLGSSEPTLKLIRERMARDWPGIRVAGTFSPPFKAVFDEQDNHAMVEAVNVAAPDVLWVGMTAPKQEKWIHQNRHRLKARFMGPIGAAFDFYAGTVKESSRWFRDHGLEWLPRLIRQPGKLWRRNFISNPMFLARVILERKVRLKEGSGHDTMFGK